VAVARLTTEHDLDPGAAENVLRYIADQELATVVVPDDRNLVIERVRDQLGDWRVCVLTPFGSRVHAPWAMAATAKLRAANGQEVETMWSEDGFVLRFPETEDAPAIDPILLEPEEAAELVLRQLGSTALFAAKFRESAARALLLPRRRADGRTPLWQQRKRAYDLLSVASRYAGFPILLEAYRECLRDVFDMPALMETLRAISNRSLRVHTVDSRTPSPFASALLFSYVANYIYDGDAPLAERRTSVLHRAACVLVDSRRHSRGAAVVAITAQTSDDSAAGQRCASRRVAHPGWLALVQRRIQQVLRKFDAVEIHELRICVHAAIERELHLPRPREHLRIFYRRFIHEMVRTYRRVPFNHVQSVAMEIPGAVEPGIFVEPGDIDNQRVSLPVAV